MMTHQQQPVGANFPPSFNSELVPADDDGIDLLELVKALWRGKWWILLTSSLGAAISIAVALGLPNIYRADALLAPSSEQQGGGLGALAGQFGGLASLAGVSLGAGKADKTGIAIEIAKSRQFLTHFARKHQLEVPLIAVNKADKLSGALIVNDEIYDSKKKIWLREKTINRPSEPTDQELWERLKSLFYIDSDKKTGLTTFSIEYYSPQLAKQWVDWLVADLNQTMKERDVAEAQRNIDYLKAQLPKTSIADMQTVFYKLIEEQTKTLMLAEVNQEYVFKTLDPAVVAEEKAKPKRALIAVLGTVLGGMAGVMLVLIRYALRRRQELN